jgi:hypothetical protein
MKTMTEKIKQRMRRDRPMITISLRMPADAIEDLKEMAPLRGFSGYQPLIRAYISQGMRRDEEAMERPEIRALQASLRRSGVTDEAISIAVAEMFQKSA